MAFPPTLGKTLLKRCNLKILQSVKNLIFILLRAYFCEEKKGIGFKRIFYECKNFFKYFAEKSYSVFQGFKGCPFNHIKKNSVKCFNFFLLNIYENAFATNSRFFHKNMHAIKK